MRELRTIIGRPIKAVRSRGKRLWPPPPARTSINLRVPYDAEPEPAQNQQWGLVGTPEPAARSAAGGSPTVLYGTSQYSLLMWQLATDCWQLLAKYWYEYSYGTRTPLLVLARTSTRTSSARYRTSIHDWQNFSFIFSLYSYEYSYKYVSDFKNNVTNKYCTGKNTGKIHDYNQSYTGKILAKYCLPVSASSVASWFLLLANLRKYRVRYRTSSDIRTVPRQYSYEYCTSTRRLFV